MINCDVYIIRETLAVAVLPDATLPASTLVFTTYSSSGILKQSQEGDSALAEHPARV